MASLIPYKGLQVLDDDNPPGAGGKAIHLDLKQLVDWSPKTVWAENDFPKNTNDLTQNFFPGSFWLQTNVTPPRLFVCQSSATGNAVWVQAITEVKVVKDTAPQLGGNLDVNGKTITSASGPVVVNPASGQVFLGSTQTTQVRGLHLNIEKNSPGIVLYDTTVYPSPSPPAPVPPPADSRGWEVYAGHGSSLGKMFFRLLSDNALSATTWLEVQRSGMTMTLIRFTGPTQIDGTLYHRQTYCDNSTLHDAASYTFNLATSDMHTANLGTANSYSNPRPLALSNVRIGQRFNVTIAQVGTGGQTVTWWNNISWPGNVVPTLTTTAGKKDVFEFLCTDVIPSAKFIGRVWGQNYPN